MTDKTTPPEPPIGYEMMLGKDVPRECGAGLLSLEGGGWQRYYWYIPSTRGSDWFALPVQKSATALPEGVDFNTSPATTALDTQVGGNRYQRFAVQPAEFIIKNNLGFAEGAVIKYVCRHAEKNGAEDLDKAMHYLQILKEMRYGKPATCTRCGGHRSVCINNGAVVPCPLCSQPKLSA